MAYQDDVQVKAWFVDAAKGKLIKRVQVVEGTIYWKQTRKWN